MRVPSFVYAGITAMLAASVSSAAPTPAVIQPPAADIALGHEIFKELIEIDSTHAHGSADAAKAIERRLLGAGFKAEDVVFLAPADQPNKGNLVVRLRAKSAGKSSIKPALFIGHLDVVDARREDWSSDPFTFSERDGYFYGRGAIDMKDGVAALVETLIRLKREGYQPEQDLLFAFTEDEEAGGTANGPAWLLAQHRDLVDARIVLNFDDGGGDLRGDERLDFQIGTSEKIYATFKIEATAPGGHGSLPGPDNPIYRISDALARLEAYKFPLLMTETTRASFAFRAKLSSGAEQADLLAVAAAKPDPAAAARLSRSPFNNAELRTTCVATLISGGHAENALPQRASAIIQCRLMPNDSIASVQRQLAAVLKDPKITLSVDVAPIAAPESPLTPAVIGKVTGVLHSLWPTVPLLPSMSTGFSDARHFRGAGMPTYGVGGVWMDMDENRAHGRDERVTIRGFDESLEYSYRLVKAFGSPE
jgi:acetylornithine deacetylase/succinyl-diaminopimelate desuccinylase-like protein